MKNLPFASVHEAAIGVQRACNKAPLPELHLLPFSRFSAEDSSLWWLCKRKARAAYDQGKWVLGKVDRFDLDSDIMVGLHVERGFIQSAGTANWKHSREWMWNQFVKDMAGEVALADAVSRASDIIGRPLDVFVTAGTEGDPNMNRVYFTSTGQSLALERADTVGDVLADVKSAGTWQELGSRLLHLPSAADWYWIEVYVLTQCSLDPAANNDLSTCVEMLSCFQKWLGKLA